MAAEDDIENLCWIYRQILGVTCNKRVTKQSTDRGGGGGGGGARDLFWVKYATLNEPMGWFFQQNLVAMVVAKDQNYKQW
jgi:hypothetical protein